MTGINHFLFKTEYWFGFHKEGPNGEPPPPIWSADNLLILWNALYSVLALIGLVAFCWVALYFYLDIKCDLQYASSSISFSSYAKHVWTTPSPNAVRVFPTSVFVVTDETPIDKISPESLLYWSPTEKMDGRDELTSLASVKWTLSMWENSTTPLPARQQRNFHALKALLETRPLFIRSIYSGYDHLGEVMEVRVGSDGEIYTDWQDPWLYIRPIILACILLVMKGVSILRDRAWNRSCWTLANGRIPTYWKRKNGLWVPIDKNNPKSFGYNNLQSTWRYSIFKGYDVKANPDIPLPPYRKVIPDPEPREPSSPAE